MAAANLWITMLWVATKHTDQESTLICYEGSTGTGDG
jgi:hypothetical protein